MLSRWLDPAIVPPVILRTILVLLVIALPLRGDPTTPGHHGQDAPHKPVVKSLAIKIIIPLIDPAKLDTLKGDRAANRRLRLISYHLEVSRRAGNDPGTIIAQAQDALGMAGTHRAEAVRSSLMRSLDILNKLGCLDVAGMGKLKTGNAPTITKGPYAGDIASVDHIVPRSIAEELDEKLFNLEFMPSRMNSKKGNKIGLRQIQLARKWHASGLLSAEGLQAVEKAAKP